MALGQNGYGETMGKDPTNNVRSKTSVVQTWPRRGASLVEGRQNGFIEDSAVRMWSLFVLGF